MKMGRLLVFPAALGILAGLWSPANAVTVNPLNPAGMPLSTIGPDWIWLLPVLSAVPVVSMNQDAVAAPTG
jgi:hypothetical protein